MTPALSQYAPGGSIPIKQEGFFTRFECRFMNSLYESVEGECKLSGGSKTHRNFYDFSNGHLLKELVKRRAPDAFEKVAKLIPAPPPREVRLILVVGEFEKRIELDHEYLGYIHTAFHCSRLFEISEAHSDFFEYMTMRTGDLLTLPPTALRLGRKSPLGIHAILAKIPG